MGIRKTTTCLLIMSFLTFLTAPLSAQTVNEVSDVNEVTVSEIPLAEPIAEVETTTVETILTETTPTETISVETPNLQHQTKVVLKNKFAISSKYVVVGHKVPFVVNEDVKDANGNTLIYAGTPASGEITDVQYNGRIGKPAKLTISGFETKASDGSKLPLFGEININPSSKMPLSIVLGCLCPLFLFMEGPDAKLNAGILQTVYTVGNTSVDVEKL